MDVKNGLLTGAFQPHADAALFPAGISKEEAYQLVELQLTGLFEGQRNWVS